MLRFSYFQWHLLYDLIVRGSLTSFSKYCLTDDDGSSGSYRMVLNYRHIYDLIVRGSVTSFSKYCYTDDGSSGSYQPTLNCHHKNSLGQVPVINALQVVVYTLYFSLITVCAFERVFEQPVQRILDKKLKFYHDASNDLNLN